MLPVHSGLIYDFTPQCTIKNKADTTIMFSKGLSNIDVMFLLNVMSFNFYKTVGGILWS